MDSDLIDIIILENEKSLSYDARCGVGDSVVTLLPFNSEVQSTLRALVKTEAYALPTPYYFFNAVTCCTKKNFRRSKDNFG